MKESEKVDLVPSEATAVRVPLAQRWAYQIGRKRKRFYFFGALVIRWRFVTRSYFYTAMMNANVLSARSDFDACDVLLACGHVFEAGPYRFRVIPA